MTLLQNHVPEDPSEQTVFDEDQRTLDLCTLIRDLEVDGIARMNASFEVLLCDYAAVGVELLYSSNVTVPGNTEREENPSLPQDPNRTSPRGFGNDFAPQNSWEWIRSGTWHYGVSTADAGSSKETRIELDLCRFLTYYDPSFRSLSGHHHGGLRRSDIYQNGWGLRRGHRLLDISHEDINSMKSRLKQIYTPKLSKHHSCSGVKWQALTETIVNQHRIRMREILATLRNAPRTPDVSEASVIRVHELSHAILFSYLQYPSAAGISPSKAKSLTISRCASIYTDHIIKRSINEFEMVVNDSIKIVMLELCAREWDLFEMKGELKSDSRDLEADLNHHLETIEKLMNWLGWDDWHSCSRKCEFDELCYIPVWPVIYAPGKHQGGFFTDDSYTEEELHEFWRPKCLNRTMFDRGGGRAREPSHQLPDVPPDPLI